MVVVVVVSMVRIGTVVAMFIFGMVLCLWTGWRARRGGPDILCRIDHLPRPLPLTEETHKAARMTRRSFARARHWLPRPPAHGRPPPPLCCGDCCGDCCGNPRPDSRARASRMKENQKMKKLEPSLAQASATQAEQPSAPAHSPERKYGAPVPVCDSFFLPLPLRINGHTIPARAYGL